MPRLEPLENRCLLASVIFDDVLQAPWQNWSWETTIDFASTSPVKNGDTAIATTHNAGWVGLFLGAPTPIEIAETDEVSFSIHGGSGGQQLKFFVVDAANNWIEAADVTPVANAWTDVIVDFESVGSPSTISGFVWQESTGQAQATFYIDEIVIDDLVGEAPIGETITVYDDQLAGGWANWSWGTTVNLTDSSNSQSGINAISARYDEAWSGLYLRATDPIPTSSGYEIKFAINGGENGGQTLNVNVYDGADSPLEAEQLTLAADTWTNVTINLQDIGAPSQINGLVFQETSGGAQATFFVDNIEIRDRTGGPIVATDGPSIVVDPAIAIGTISDDIYGLNFADPALASDIGLTVNRWGGNSTTRYNYLLDVSNKGSDFYFENIPNDNDNLDQLPSGSSSDRFVSSNLAIGSDAIMTMTTIGWTPKSRQITGGFAVDKYGAQQDTNHYRPNHGTGVLLDGSLVVGNDPTDTSIAIDEEFIGGWVDHLTSQFGTASQGGVQYYALDNEPMLWDSTHRDVHPNPASYDEVLGKGVSYATAIKEADPSAEILGPTVWGWSAYFYSALDSSAEGAWWNNPQDRNAHGGTPFLPWYLSQMAEAEEDSGTRLLDYLDIHYYPQSGVALGAAGDTTTQDLRLRSTRSLWDPSYVDESWIDEEVQLIPRMRDWIDDNYPGTKLAITEYNFGGVEHINGAITQADVLGIFGREGVDLATMWDPPNSNDPTAYAFRMYRNYDGQGSSGSRFGETSLTAGSTDSDQVSVFAARRGTDDAITVMLVNKTRENLVTPVELQQIGNRAAEIYTYDASDLNAIVRGTDIEFVSGSAEVELPAHSITLLEFDSAPSLVGDFNEDQTVDVTDLDLMCSAIRNSQNSSQFDLNDDNSVNHQDFDEMIGSVIGTVFGDTNLDGIFNSTDLILVFRSGQYEDGIAGNSRWRQGDWDCDGEFASSDIIKAFQDGGYADSAAADVLFDDPFAESVHSREVRSREIRSLSLDDLAAARDAWFESIGTQRAFVA